jgi:hypothetical protein
MRGVEPPRPCEHYHLKVACIPFHHIRILANFTFWCTIWNDVRTYLTSTISHQEKTALLLAISHFKNKKEDLK